MRYFVVLFLFSVSNLACSQKHFIEVQAGEYEREATPISFQLPKGVKYNALLNPDNQDTIYLAKSIKDTTQVFFLLDQFLEKGNSRKYQLLYLENYDLIQKNFQSWRHGKSVKLKLGNQNVLAYNFGVLYPKFDAPEPYKRSGFLHPIYTPDGTIISDGFPVGHTHQNGIFNAWVNTTFQDKKVDFWNRQQETATVKSQSQTEGIAYYQSGNGSRSYEDTLLHIAIDTAANKEQLVLKEIQSLTLYPNTSIFLFDLHSHQKNVADDTLFINQYHYGGMAFRGSREWNEVDSLHFTNKMKVITNEGITRAESNYTRPNWVCAYGKIEGKEVGVAVYSHPNNFRAPQFVRVHPKMPYFCFTPTVEEGFSIAPEESYEAQFRFVTFDGKPNLELLERLWLDYAFPTRVQLMSERK